MPDAAGSILALIRDAFDPRGKRRRPGFAGQCLAGIGGLLVAYWLAGQGQPLSFLAPLLTPVFLWLLLCATIRRLHDSGHSGFWLLMPLALALVAFVLTAQYYDPDLVSQASPLLRSAAVITLVPALGLALATVVVKIAAGLFGFLVVWLVFLLVLLALPSQEKEI